MDRLTAHRNEAGAPSAPGIAAVIPVYDHQEEVVGVLDGLARHGLHCFVIDDGSPETCRRALERLCGARSAGVTLVRLPLNRGKGGAVLAGLRAAARQGHRQALQIDADGQHDIDDLPRFLALARTKPQAVICGTPRFDESAPRARKYGRWLTSVWVWINSLSFAIQDALCGYRVYPLEAVLRLAETTRLGQRMDFDPEVLVRLSWAGVEIVNLPTRVRYPAGGRSHFRLWRDNGLISLMHVRLFFGMLVRAPRLLARKRRKILPALEES